MVDFNAMLERLLAKAAREDAEAAKLAETEVLPPLPPPPFEIFGRPPDPAWFQRHAAPATVRVLYDPSRDPRRSDPPPPPRPGPGELVIGWPTGRWAATPEQRYRLIEMMRSRYPAETDEQLFSRLRNMDGTDAYEMLLNNGQDSAPDRYHTGGAPSDMPLGESAYDMDNWGSLSSSRSRL